MQGSNPVMQIKKLVMQGSDPVMHIKKFVMQGSSNGKQGSTP
jgi:hypothetical protein